MKKPTEAMDCDQSRAEEEEGEKEEDRMVGREGRKEGRIGKEEPETGWVSSESESAGQMGLKLVVDSGD